MLVDLNTDYLWSGTNTHMEIILKSNILGANYWSSLNLSMNAWIHKTCLAAFIFECFVALSFETP